ncbi:MAG: UDP-N-acetylmuramate--L-alanine ligase [Flavobacteriaceae bacterium]|nr:UDP-N-acetylmuramate--L-alanine ligase [Flavobacteriaceae bacterium]
MELNKIENIYFIGIGGIGMSALAKYFLSLDKRVYGYDKVKTELTIGLETSGAIVSYSEDKLSQEMLSLNVDNTIVVYTPAMPSDSKTFKYFITSGFQLYKRAELLGAVTKDSFTLAVAGTHGKTTTSCILGHIFEVDNQKATSFLGGISENYNSNLILGEDKITIVEADEYDKSFLNLSPNIACITSMDADHLDIYKDESYFEETFKTFAKKVSDKIIVKKGLPISGITYSAYEPADYMASNISFENGYCCFEITNPKGDVVFIEFAMVGIHNVENALAAYAMAECYGVNKESIKKALKSFKGVKRRFSYKINTDDLVLIDDYAHHPKEIDSVCSSLRVLYPNDEILAVFQPHLYSRTKDFMTNFASSLSKFDKVLLLDIYPARELPIEGITSDVLLDKITIEDKLKCNKEELISLIKASNNRVIVMMGAGDIGVEINKVVDSLT